MGRIKTAKTKRITFDLMERYGDRFTSDFAQNKLILNQLTSTESLKLRNVIAGYLTRLVKSRQR
ncbi:MAG: 30S ribosomal protein S17e [archaeon]